MNISIKTKKFFIYMMIVLMCSFLLNIVFGIIIKKMLVSANNSQYILEERITDLKENSVNKDTYQKIVDDRDYLLSELNRIEELQAK